MRAALLALLMAAVATGCSRGPQIAILAPDGAARATVNVEVADTPHSREAGLMYRDDLGRDAGMIFVFSHSEPQTFWMKNTAIPLDMIFAAPDGRVIGIVANAEPYSETLLSVPGKSQYVLEVNGGFCKARGVLPGDRFDFRGFTPRARD